MSIKQIENWLLGAGVDLRILNHHMVRKGIRMAISAVVVLLVWQVVATTYFEPRTLPAPTLVWEEIMYAVNVGGPRGNLAWYHVTQSLTRVAIAAAIGMTAAVVIGILMGINEYIEDALALWLPFWMTLPTVVVVLIAMIMFQFSQLSVIVSVVFAATPYAAINTWKGVQNIDPELIEMARAFEVSEVSVWRHIYVPAIMPSIFGSLRYLVSMIWKIVVLAEVFGMNNGLGAMFRFWFSQSEVAPLLAYLFLFVGVMFVIEYGMLYPAERYLFRWRE